MYPRVCVFFFSGLIHLPEKKMVPGEFSTGVLSRSLPSSPAASANVVASMLGMPSPLTAIWVFSFFLLYFLLDPRVVVWSFFPTMFPWRFHMDHTKFNVLCWVSRHTFKCVSPPNSSAIPNFCPRDRSVPKYSLNSHIQQSTPIITYLGGCQNPVTVGKWFVHWR